MFDVFSETERFTKLTKDGSIHDFQEILNIIILILF